MRLIDADCLKEKGHYDDHDVFVVDYDDIKNAPTIDTVKHGRWEDCSNGWMCSVCKHDARKDYPYCPNCGAMMDGESNETRTL